MRPGGDAFCGIKGQNRLSADSVRESECAGNHDGPGVQRKQAGQKGDG